MHIKNKKGQSTVEYILLVTAVVTVIILFVTSNNTGGFKQTLNAVLNQSSQDMNSMAGVLVGSHAGTTAQGPGPSYTVNVAP